MKTRAPALAVASILLLPAAAVAQQPTLVKRTASSIETAAIAQEQRVLQAILRGDAAAMNAAIGPSVLMVGTDGISIWTTETTTAFMSACRSTSLAGTDFQTVTAGKDVVVLAYRGEGEQRCGGRPTDGLTHALSVWQRKGSDWSLVAHTETPPKALPAGYDGAYQYLPPLKGLAVYNGRHYNFLFGPTDGSSMMANAGTYEMIGDTAVATIGFSTDPANAPGSKFRFLIRYLQGDTVEYAVLDAAGKPTNVGRTIRIR